MKPAVTLAQATTPDGVDLTLIAHDGHFYLHADGQQIQSSFAHGAARQLGALACPPFRSVRQPRLLFAGLGLGFTLAAVREALPQKRATLLVVEPCEELAAWHRKFLIDLHPGQLDDPRVVIRTKNLLEALKGQSEGFHAILLDATGLPPVQGVTDRKALPVSSFLHQAFSSLNEGGLLAVSSSGDDPTVERRLRQAGFDVAHETVPSSHKGKQKRRSSIWLARKGAYENKRAGRGNSIH